MRMPLVEIYLELQDTEWPFEFTDHDRTIVRTVVYDDAGFFYFVRANRDDEFGRATLIEISGGGVEEGGDLLAAIKDYCEQTGAEADVNAIPTYKTMNKMITGKLDALIGEHIKEKRKDL